MAETLNFPIQDKYMFSSIQQATKSLMHFYKTGEAKSCSIVRTVDSIIIRTPHGMGKFSLREWNNSPFKFEK